MSAARSTANGPWCWQTKAALRAIRDGLAAENGVASGLAVYLALTELASDNESATFQTTHVRLASLTGLSPRTIQTRISGLEELGLIRIETPALRAPSRFTVLPFGNGCHSNGNGCVTFGNQPEQGSLPTLEERERKGEEAEKNLPRAKGGAQRAGNDTFEVLAELVGWSPTDPLTPSAAGRVGKALQEILSVNPGVTASDIRARIEVYRRKMPRAPVTPTAISANWQILKPSAPEDLKEGFIE